MSQAIVNPEELRRFAGELKTFNENLTTQIARLHARFKVLGETWRDQEHARFAQVFEETVKGVSRFIQESKDYTPFLIRKAEAAEEYLRRR